MPRVERVAALFNPAQAPTAEYHLNSFKAAAASFAVEANAVPVRDRSELELVVTAQARAPNWGLVVVPDAFLTAHRMEITSLAARYRLPAVYPFRFFAEVGGLLFYGADLADSSARGRLRRSHPQGSETEPTCRYMPTKFELVINLKTAKTLGLDIPPTLLARADEVIE